MSGLRIINARLIDAEGIVERGSLYMENGRIAADSGAPCREIDAAGLTVMPSLVDLHVHLRDPGWPEKEDIASGLRAMLRGGFGTVAAMANTKPVTETVEQVEENHRRAAALDITRLYQAAAAGCDLADETPTDYAALCAVTPMISNDGKTIFSDSFMEQLLAQSHRLGFLVSTHCEPEEEIVARDIALQKKVGGRLHVGHISLGATLELLRRAKAECVQDSITCEVTPHHLVGYDNPYRVNPPMRTHADTLALIEGVRRGEIDCLSTDHAPHTPADKAAGMAGISCCDYALYLWLRVFRENDIPLTRFCQMSSYTPAKLLGLPGERLLKEGCEADVIVVDTDCRRVLREEMMASRSKNSPFFGQEIDGCVAAHLLGGEVKFVHEDYARRLGI